MLLHCTGSFLISIYLPFTSLLFVQGIIIVWYQSALCVSGTTERGRESFHYKREEEKFAKNRVKL